VFGNKISCVTACDDFSNKLHVLFCNSPNKWEKYLSKTPHRHINIFPSVTWFLVQHADYFQVYSC